MKQTCTDTAADTTGDTTGDTAPGIAADASHGIVPDVAPDVAPDVEGRGKKFLPGLPQYDGVLVLHKPQGPTSARCLNMIKHGLGQKKIGHAGTLDPMASGVLLVLLGQATKISGYLMEAGEKVYSGSIRLGVSTDTWDAMGRILEERPVPRLSEQEVAEALQELIGTYEQEVPAYAAAKHEGKPLYALARKGLAVPVKKKVITISSGCIESVDIPHIRFRVTCSSGTYIRSLAHSLGTRLGCGAMLEELTREHSHPFGIHRAHPLDELLADPGGLGAKLEDIADALPDWPVVRLSDEEAAKIRNGVLPVFSSRAFDRQVTLADGLKAVLSGPEGKALALARLAVADNGTYKWDMLRGLWNL